jgi:hypothetical protein
MFVDFNLLFKHFKKSERNLIPKQQENFNLIYFYYLTKFPKFSLPFQLKVNKNMIN